MKESNASLDFLHVCGFSVPGFSAIVLLARKFWEMKDIHLKYKESEKGCSLTNCCLKPNFSSQAENYNRIKLPSLYSHKSPCVSFRLHDGIWCQVSCSSQPAYPSDILVTYRYYKRGNSTHLIDCIVFRYFAKMTLPDADNFKEKCFYQKVDLPFPS